MLERKFKFQNLLTFFFLSMSCLYIGMTILVIQMVYVFNSVMTAAHGPPFGIILLFPHYISLPLLFVVASFTYFHLSLKIREGSKLSWILGFLFLVALPYPLYKVAQLNITPLIQQLGYTTINNSFQTWNYITLSFVAISMIILIISYRNFIFEGCSLQNKSKNLLALFFFIIAFPTIVFCFYIYYQANYHDKDYRKLQNATSFHIYQPTFFPSGRSFETVYYVLKKGLIPNEKTIQVDINYSIKDIMNGKKSGLISLKQSSINKAFDYEKFIKNYRVEIPDIKKISLATAQEGSAVIKQKKDAKYIIFLSKSNTLIIISAFYIDNKELFKFADSLK